MTAVKLLVVSIAVALGGGGLATALGDWRSGDAGPVIELSDGRKDDSTDVAAVEDEPGDGDDTQGDDGAGGGDDTRERAAGDRDATRADAGTDGQDETAARRPAPGGDDVSRDDSASAGADT